MRIRSVIPYLAVGLCALPGVPVHAVPGSMTLINFNDWVLNDPVNAPIFLQLTQDLQAFFVGATVTHKMNIEYPDNEPMSLGTLFAELTSLFEEIGAREASRASQNQNAQNVQNAGGTDEVAQVSPRAFWENSVADLKRDFEGWTITIRNRVWEDPLANNFLRQQPLFDAVNELAEYLQYNVDLSDPTRVAMWVLGGRLGVVAGDVVTYDTIARDRLRAPFNIMGEAFGNLAALVTTLYNSASRRLTDPADRWYLAQVEDSLRRLQNFCYFYEGLFE
ncbi:hypothetical protein Dda_2027 [Drechslerella dactyloides]|uniref:Uncharacterized protein n=1 Tax=Drechslerella dactyloides TaxID=74499 RepID=A0AAD6J2Y2_DREDA|nr:hypothetical protein Dda_2027 [Drechslerella dactyloides]